MFEGASRRHKEPFNGGHVIEVSNTQLAEAFNFDGRPLTQKPISEIAKIYMVDRQEIETAAMCVVALRKTIRPGNVQLLPVIHLPIATNPRV